MHRRSHICTKAGRRGTTLISAVVFAKKPFFFLFLFFFFFFFPEQQWQWRETREAEWVETDLMRQRDHSLPSDLANIPGASSRLFCWSARPFFSRYGCLLSCFISQDSHKKKKKKCISRGFYFVDNLLWGEGRDLLREQSSRSCATGLCMYCITEIILSVGKLSPHERFSQVVY